MRAGPALALLLLAGALAGCTAPAAELRARPGDFAVVDLAAFDAAGREVENATGVHAVLGDEAGLRLPPGWTAAGTRPLPPGVVAALAGRAAGEVVETALLPAEQAYGNWSAERTVRAPQSEDLPVEVALGTDVPAAGNRVTWAGQSWQVETLDQGGAGARVRLVGGPAEGARLELPAYWNAHYQLWPSRFVSLNATALRVEHRAQLGHEADVGGVRYVVTRAAGEAVADGNPPLAGQALRFRVALRALAFPPGAGAPEAPDAPLVAADGLRLNISDLRGHAVLLDFFATWCVTCKQQAPVLARAREHFGANLTIVSITIDPTDTAERIAAFRDEVPRASRGAWGRELPADWLFAFDPTGQAAKGFSVTGIPRSVLLDGEGRIRATAIGLHPWPELRDDVAAVIAAS